MTEARDGAGGYHVGLLGLLGRPNTGKSTLSNALVGEKVTVVSDRPQTTRRIVRGIAHRPNGQLVLIDTPGAHRPRTLLGEHLNQLTRDALGEADVLAQCFPVAEPIGKGDRLISAGLDQVPEAARFALVTKIDDARRHDIAAALLAVSELRDWDEVVPVSAVTGEGLDRLIDLALARMPEAPGPLYPADMRTEDGVEIRVAEIIREKCLPFAEQELPHSIAVVVEEIAPRAETPDGTRRLITDVYAKIVVERVSQQGIVIGNGGSRLREIGTLARPEIEALLHSQVYLRLQVTVARNWQRDPKLLARLGF